MSTNIRQVSGSDRRPLAASLILCTALGLFVWILWGWVWTARDLGPVIPAGFSPTIPKDQLLAVLAFLALNLAAIGWGAMALGLLRIPPPSRPVQALAVQLSLGHLVLGALTFLVGVAQLLPWGLLALAVGLLGLRSGPFRPALESLRKCDCLTAIWLGLAAVPLGLSFLAALAPVVESDGLRYHLFGPQEYLKAGAIVPLPYHAFTNLPFQTNMVFMSAMVLGGERAAQLVHWTYLPLLMVFATALAERLARSLGLSSPRWVSAGVLAGLAPVMTLIAAWPFVDLSTAAYLLAATWALCPGALRRLDDRLLLAGCFAGAALGTKLTAVVPIALLGLPVLALLASRPRGFARLALFVVPVVLIPAPWLVKNVLLHGNPVYPAAYGLLGGAEWDPETDAFYKAKAAEKGFGKGPIELLRSPWDITVAWKSAPGQPGFEDQNPGPMALALLPAALVALAIGLWRRRRAPVLWLVGAQLLGGWLFWFAAYQSVRFLLVPLAMIALTGTVGLHLPHRWRPLVQAVLLALGLSAVAWHATYVLAVAPTRPVLAGLGMIEEERFLSATLNFYDAVQWLNMETEPGEAVFYIGEHRGLYARYPVILSDWFDLPRVLVEIRATPNNDALLIRWREEQVRYVLFNFAELRLYEQAYFRPRFTEEEWARYQALVDRLLKGVVFRPREHVYVIDLKAV